MTDVQIPPHARRGIARDVALLVLLAALIYLVGHNHENSLYVYSGWDGGISEGLSAISEGSIRRRLGITGFGLLGGLLLLRRRPARVRLDPVVTGAAVLFMLWISASIVWADDVMLSLRRVVAFWLLVVGAAGVALVVSRQTLVWFIGLSGATFIVAGVGVELLLGTFQPFSPTYRFAGTLHPNAQGINCAFVVLSAVWIASTNGGRKWLFAGLLAALGCIFLVLTKSRAPFATMLGSVLVLLVLRFRPGRRMIIVAVVANAGLALVFAYLNGLIDAPLDWLLLGRGFEDVATLNSRVPLWRFLGTYVAHRPVAGYGYSGFMTTEHAAEIPVLLEFGVAGAHSIYMEILLGVGVVGLALFLLFMVSGFVRAAGGTGAREARNADSFVASIVAFELLMGIVDATLVFPSWRIVTLILLASLCIAERSSRRELRQPAPSFEWMRLPSRTPPPVP